MTRSVGSRAKACAMASPRPRAPPVTTATRLLAMAQIPGMAAASLFSFGSCCAPLPEPAQTEPVREQGCLRFENRDELCAPRLSHARLDCGDAKRGNGMAVSVKHGNAYGCHARKDRATHERISPFSRLIDERADQGRRKARIGPELRSEPLEHLFTVRLREEGQQHQASRAHAQGPSITDAQRERSNGKGSFRASDANRLRPVPHRDVGRILRFCGNPLECGPSKLPYVEASAGGFTQHPEINPAVIAMEFVLFE